MRRALAIAAALLAVALFLSAASAEARFPQPEFDSGHTPPSPTTPEPRQDTQEYIDLAVLGAALVLVTWLELKRRSRKAVFAVGVFSIAYFGFWRRGCVCSVGSVQNVTLALFDSSYVVPIVVTAFFALPLLFALFFGRVFCAAVCPLGAIQDVAVFRPVRVPSWLEHSLGMLPIAYLAVAIVFAATATGFPICRYDPFVGFFRLGGHAEMLIFGGALLALGLVVARPYCRYLCPYGVLLKWFSRLSKWHLSITPDECVKCRLCENSCPFGAIEKPTPERVDESRNVGVRRLAVLIALLPVLAGAGAFAGRLSAEPLSGFSKPVITAEQVRLEEEVPETATTLESEAFAATGRPRAELYAEAISAKADLRFGMTIAGAALGLVFGLKLIALSVRRKREDYEPDKGNCLSCGRCFEYCPREHLRLKNKKEQTE